MSEYRDMTRVVTNRVWEKYGPDVAAEFAEMADSIAGTLEEEEVVASAPPSGTCWNVDFTGGAMWASLPEGQKPPNAWWRFWQWVFFGCRWFKS